MTISTANAKVARIGRKDYAREELPPTRWREQLKALAWWVCLGLMGWLIFGITAVAWMYA